MENPIVFKGKKMAEMLSKILFQVRWKYTKVNMCYVHKLEKRKTNNKTVTTNKQKTSCFTNTNPIAFHCSQRTG